MKCLLGLSIALQAMDLSNSWFVLPSYSSSKPNRISQKKRRLNQRRKGK